MGTFAGRPRMARSVHLGRGSALAAVRCNEANIDIVTSYTKLFPHPSSSAFPSEQRKAERARERERNIYRSRGEAEGRAPSASTVCTVDD